MIEAWCKHEEVRALGDVRRNGVNGIPQGVKGAYQP